MARAIKANFVNDCQPVTQGKLKWGRNIHSISWLQKEAWVTCRFHRSTVRKKIFFFKVELLLYALHTPHSASTFNKLHVYV